jgi:hypothetical protein
LKTRRAIKGVVGCEGKGAGSYLIQASNSHVLRILPAPADLDPSGERLFFSLTKTYICGMLGYRCSLYDCGIATYCSVCVVATSVTVLVKNMAIIQEQQ